MLSVEFVVPEMLPRCMDVEITMPALLRGLRTRLYHKLDLLQDEHNARLYRSNHQVEYPPLAPSNSYIIVAQQYSKWAQLCPRQAPC